LLATGFESKQVLRTVNLGRKDQFNKEVVRHLVQLHQVICWLVAQRQKAVAQQNQGSLFFLKDNCLESWMVIEEVNTVPPGGVPVKLNYDALDTGGRALLDQGDVYSKGLVHRANFLSSLVYCQSRKLRGSC
jgi:hypothetical protein